jgi:hypothetical protein
VESQNLTEFELQELRCEEHGSRLGSERAAHVLACDLMPRQERLGGGMGQVDLPSRASSSELSPAALCHSSAAAPGQARKAGPRDQSFSHDTLWG